MLLLLDWATTLKQQLLLGFSPANPSIVTTQTLFQVDVQRSTILSIKGSLLHVCNLLFHLFLSVIPSSWGRI